MSRVDRIATERLALRRWRDEDREPFAALNADDEVMRHFPAPLTRAQSDAFVDRIEVGFELHGYGLWAVERIDTGSFIGFVGLSDISYDAHFTPATEIGWRLARDAWGRGFATEAARAVLRTAFGTLTLDEIVSCTAVANLPSRRVMERIGMSHDAADDFDHPNVAASSPLARHVLYRIRRG